MGIPRHVPPAPSRTKAQGTQPWAETPPPPPPRVNSLPDLGSTILAGGQWGSFSLFTCCAGRATRNPNAGGAARPRKTTSISEPSQSFSLLIIFPTETTCQESGLAPRLLSTGTSAVSSGGHPWSGGGSLLARDRMESRDSGQVLTRSGGVGLASPRGLSTERSSPPPQGPERHLWV